jgi:hypothetical protein
MRLHPGAGDEEGRPGLDKITVIEKIPDRFFDLGADRGTVEAAGMKGVVHPPGGSARGSIGSEKPGGPIRDFDHISEGDALRLLRE